MAKAPKLNRAISAPDKIVAPGRKRAIDYDLLTEADKERIRAEAQAKIDERAKLEAEKAYYEAQVEELERAKYPEIFEEKFDIVMDLGVYARIADNKSGITLDGKHYLHGVKYTVPRSVYQVLKESEQATKRHEDSIHSGDDYNSFYRRERNQQANLKNDPNAIQMSARGGITAGGQPVNLRTHF